MSRNLPEYLAAARHPWACVLFVLPLLLVYEAHLYLLGPDAQRLTGGADTWARQALGHAGLTAPLAAPLLLVAGLLAWGLYRPLENLRDPVGTWAGMALESVGFALLLFGLVQLCFPLLAGLGGVLQDPLSRFLSTSAATPEWTGDLIFRFMGAGIYEEAIFRLLLFSCLRLLLRAGDFPPNAAAGLAAVVSALLFAAAHHLGGGPERFHATVFLYRTLAGLYFAWLFTQRGFGVAVGAHAGYDVLVGLVLR